MCWICFFLYFDILYLLLLTYVTSDVQPERATSVYTRTFPTTQSVQPTLCVSSINQRAFACAALSRHQYQHDSSRGGVAALQISVRSRMTGSASLAECARALVFGRVCFCADFQKDMARGREGSAAAEIWCSIARQTFHRSPHVLA